MCGIAGIIDYQSKSNKEYTVENMLSVISYRGPDESGIYESPFATLGSVRLRIIDIAGGQQPLSDPSGRYWIVFNGEIFNYLELRAELEARGNKFATHSDTEVLVQLYATFGKNCLSKLNGQFAFAIWDKQKEEAFFARDRVGIRPFFYNLSPNGELTFASEIKSIFENKKLKPEFSPENLSQVYTFWTTITPDTVFKSVYELPPGHYMTYSREGLHIEKFWELDFSKINRSITLEEAQEQFNELLTDAVRIRLRADVEVAAYLSGGLDSSATVSYIKKLESRVLNTFSIGFQEKDFDESAYQQEAVKYLDTNHRYISCSSQEIGESFPKAVWHSETPMIRTAPTPMLLLSEQVRNSDIKVVITGEGADEMLAGYNIFKEAKIRRFWAKQPDSRIRPLLLKKLYPYLPQMQNANPAILKMFFGFKLQDTENPFYSHLLRWNNSNHIKKHFSDEIKSALNDFSPFEKLEARIPAGFDSWGGLEKSQWLESTLFMSGYLLSSQGDRMAMANSVEGRYPFLDYRVIEFCTSLPDSLKLKGLNEKYLLKKLLKNRIPDSILNRSKQAYRAPIKSVLASKDKPDYVSEMLSERTIKKVGIFNPKSISDLIAKIERSGAGSEVDNMALTAIVSTHLLYSQFMEGKYKGKEPNKLNNLKIIKDT